MPDPAKPKTPHYYGPINKFCACGQKAYKEKARQPVCERCDRIEQKLLEEERYGRWGKRPSFAG